MTTCYNDHHHCHHHHHQVTDTTRWCDWPLQRIARLNPRASAVPEFMFSTTLCFTFLRTIHNQHTTWQPQCNTHTLTLISIHLQLILCPRTIAHNTIAILNLWSKPACAKLCTHMHSHVSPLFYSCAGGDSERPTSRDPCRFTEFYRFTFIFTQYLTLN